MYLASSFAWRTFVFSGNIQFVTLFQTSKQREKVLEYKSIKV
jgi:hypothetical protein